MASTSGSSGGWIGTAMFVAAAVQAVAAIFLWRVTKGLTNATKELVAASDAQYQAGVLRDAAAEFGRLDYFRKFWQADMLLRAAREDAKHNKIVVHVVGTTRAIEIEDWGPAGPSSGGSATSKVPVPNLVPNDFLGFYYLSFPLASGIRAELIVKAMSLQFLHAFRDHLRLVHAMRRLTKTEGPAYLPQAYGLEDAEFLRLYRRLWDYVRDEGRLPPDQVAQYQAAADVVDRWLEASPRLDTREAHDQFWGEQLGVL